MGIIVGSARLGENGSITGGKLGDQTGKEVSTQAFYMHSKGLYRLRPKSVAHANKMAKAMKDACDNNHIGYDQTNRAAVKMVQKYGSLKAISENTETDCSNLVRACILEATGKDVGNFSTADEAKVLESSGLFETRVEVKSAADVADGDVLVTKTKGHTLIVVSGNPRKESKSTNATVVSKDGHFKGIVTANLLNVRSGAGAEYPNIKSYPTIKKGTEVEVCDTLTASNGTPWYYIKIKDKHGYVNSKYIKKA